MIDISSLSYYVISIALLLISYIFKNKKMLESNLTSKFEKKKSIKRGYNIFK